MLSTGTGKDAKTQFENLSALLLAAKAPKFPKPSGWTSALNRSLFVLMSEPRYTVLSLIGDEPDAVGLTLDEAFARIMALSERQYAFARVGRVMRLYVSAADLGEPEFESDLPTDIYARRAIKAQVCEHGLGRYRVEATVPDIPRESRAA